MTQHASICLFRGIPVCYTYSIPKDMQDNLSIGTHVTVPLGPSTVTGLVLSIDDAPLKKTIKPISYIAEDLPQIPADICALITWFYTYYQCTPYKAYQTIVGKRKKRKDQTLSPSSNTASPYTLTDEQQQAYDAIIKTPHTHVLHGVTGSGKTEIYLRLAQWALDQEKGIIVCCPEISLTPQYTQQFSERFGNKIALIHSGLTPKKRDEALENIKTGQTPIVIGPRSSIFAPVSKLAMIVIDEEHDGSYKQDNHPRYYTHTIAKKRCQAHGCGLVLGSATPSLETVLIGQEQGLSRLNKRATGSRLPTVQVVDMTDFENQKSLISPVLIEQLEHCLKKKQKAMILLNRRGYAPYISCQKCSTVHSCPDCQLSYTYHKDKTFRCHRCHHSVPFSHTCLKCKKPTLAFGGQAIQKVELELAQYFSEAKIIRLDKDTAKTATQMEEILTAFKQSGDILIGTQLIAKGHHIESVTLVGVIGIDTQLNLPDFRSAERSFQLMMQVSGRAGRGQHPGHVVIQSKQANHYAITHAKTHDNQGFIDAESQFRQRLSYPPFIAMTALIISSPYPRDLQRYSQSVTEYLNSQDLTDIACLGPKPAPIEKVRAHYRQHVLFKHQPQDNQRIRTLLSQFPTPPKYCRVIPDFDPQQLL